MLGAEPLHWGLLETSHYSTAHTNSLLTVFKNKDHCSAQQNNPIKMAARCCAAVFTGVPVKLHQLKCWGFISLTCHTAHCALELPVKLCCFCWDALCALLGLLVVPTLTFNFPVFWTAQTLCCHCTCSLILLSSHSAPFCSRDLSMLYLAAVWVKKDVVIGFSWGASCSLLCLLGSLESHSGQLHLDAAAMLLSMGTHPYFWGLQPRPRELPE